MFESFNKFTFRNYITDDKKAVKIPDGEKDPSPKKKRQYIFCTLSKLAFYILYIVDVCILTFGTSTTGSFYLTTVVYELFIDTSFKGYAAALTSFRDTDTPNDFWAFAEKVMIPGLERKDDLGLTTKRRGGQKHDTSFIGRVRLRQIRVNETDCPILNVRPFLARTCYPRYDANYEEREPFDKKNPNRTDGWKYNTQEELGGRAYWGKLATYGGGGAILLLKRDTGGALQQLVMLKNSLWITRATRIIILEFTLFNPNLELFCIVRLAWELPSTGGVTTSWDIQTVRLVRYSTASQYFIYICEIIFICFTVYFIIDEVASLIVEKPKKYFKNLWSYLTATIIGISILCIQHSFRRYSETNKILESSTKKPKDFYDLQDLAYWEKVYNDTAAVCIFLVWVKLFQYLSFNRSMSQLSGTMVRCAQDIGGFGVIFLVIFMAFAQLGYSAFGSQVEDFSTFSRSIFSLLRFILGDFNYRPIAYANRVLGPIYYLSYVTFVFFILVEMFLAIVNDSYDAVKEEILLQKNKISFEEVAAAITCSKDQHKNDGPQTAETIHDVFLDPSEIRKHLKEKYFTEVEVQMFMARFDVDEDDTLDADESQKLLSDLTHNSYRGKEKTRFQAPKGYEDLHVAFKNAESKDLAKSELQEMTRRLSVVETAVVGLVPKIEALLVEIDRKLKKNK